MTEWYDEAREIEVQQGETLYAAYKKLQDERDTLLKRVEILTEGLVEIQAHSLEFDLDEIHYIAEEALLGARKS